MMKRVASILFAITLGALAAQPAVAEDRPQGMGPAHPSVPSTSDDALEQPPANAAVGSASQRVFVDPETGELVSPARAMPKQAPPANAAFSTSHEGLVEEESPVPGGGVMVDLQGRFQSPLMVTLDSDGGVEFTHEHAAANPKEGE
jgi:hypothetical protein